jgi:hypothetical protein
MKIAFLSDFFIEDFVGGAEASDDALLESFKDRNIEVQKIKCINVNNNNINNLINHFLIISNFATLSEDVVNFITKKCKYIIYEHDYKFLSLRDPAKYENSNPRSTDVINYSFYNNAKCVFLQTTKHSEIYSSTTGLSNFETVNGSLWTKKSFEVLEKYCNQDKKEKSAIVGYQQLNKGRVRTVEYCINNGIEYEIVETNQDFETFIKSLSCYKKLIFMPICYESCSRITLEARMLNMSVMLNNNVPVKHEDYFKTTKGVDLINLMKNLPHIVCDRVLSYM